jgi:hypothetical protein
MSSGVIRAGGLAGVLAAGAFVLSAIFYQFAPLDGAVDTAGEYGYRAATIVAYLAAIVAILGVHALHSGHARYGALGTTGAITTIAGYAAFTIVTLIATVRDFEYLLTARIAAAVVLLVGSALLGILIIRARVLPWWCGVLLIVAFPLGDVANALFPTAENFLLALLWGSVGYGLLSRGRRLRTADPSRPPVTERSRA